MGRCDDSNECNYMHSLVGGCVSQCCTPGVSAWGPENVNWIGSAAAPVPVTLANSAFSARWEGLVEPDKAGQGTFTFLVDLGSSANDERVRLWVDNALIIDQWTSLATCTNCKPSGTIALLSSSNIEYYDIKLEYKTMKSGEDDNVQLKWVHSDNGEAIVPSSRLFESFLVTNEPKRVRFNPNVACGVTSTRSGAGLTVATAGVQASFTLTSYDAYGNIRGTGADRFVVRAFRSENDAAASTAANRCCNAATNFLSTVSDCNSTNDANRQIEDADCECNGCPAIVRGTVTDHGDATYGVTYTATKRGAYKVFSSLAVLGGLYATFYDNQTSGNPTALTDHHTLDFSSSDDPDTTPSVTNAFDAVWEGFVLPSKAAQYTFTTQVDQNSRVQLWLDNVQLIDQWNSLGSQTPSGTVSFGLVNHLYDLKVKYAGSTAAERLTLKWESRSLGVASDDVALGTIRSSRLWYRSDVWDRCKKYKWTGSDWSSQTPQDANTCTGNAISDGGITRGTDGSGSGNAMDRGGSPYEWLHVHPAAACASTSVAKGDQLSITTAGIASSFTLTARDAYDNQRTINSDMTFSIDLVGSAGLPVYQGSVSTMSGTGAMRARYEASYTVTAAKNYELFIRYGSDNVRSSPFTLSSRPAVVCGAWSTVTGFGLTAVSIGAKSAFTVLARDKGANINGVSCTAGDFVGTNDGLHSGYYTI